MKRTAILLVALAALSSPIDVDAQVAGTISGYIRDESGAVVPGVDVKATMIGQQLNRSTVSEAPSTSTNTPPASLPTSPASPSRPARACTNGRKPTPCTIPSTLTRVRVSAMVPAAYDDQCED